MSEPAYFYNSNDGDRVYDADSFSNWLKQLFTDGIVSNTLQVVANGDMTLTVKKGTALIGGKVKIFSEDTTVRLSTASGTLNRIDSIVVKRDDERRDFYIEVLKGTAAATPQAPTITRAGNIYELKLADVYIGKGVITIKQADITDTRANRSACGWIIGNTQTIETEQILAQMNNDFTTWFNAMKNQLSTDAAGHLQTQINALNNKIKYGTTLPTSGTEGDVFILIES